MIGPTEFILGDEWSKVLSPREREVAVLVACGLSNKDVARELGLRVGTVKTHLHTIYRKLAVDGRNSPMRPRNSSVAAYNVGSSPSLADEEEPLSSHNGLIQNI
jgi:DNA-binding CsgD family transcriptional regulator